MAERKSFGQLRNVLEMPDLIGLQVDSYDNFLQRFVPPAERKRQGLQEIFMDIFPIESFDKNMSLEFVSYEIGECPPQKSDVIDCIKDGKIYDAPLYVNFLLKVKDLEIPERVFYHIKLSYIILTISKCLPVKNSGQFSICIAINTETLLIGSIIK